MSSAARSKSNVTHDEPRVLLASTDVGALSTVAAGLGAEGHAVSVARNEQDLLHVLLAVETGVLPALDAVVLEASLVGPPALRALRAMRKHLPRTALLFVASNDDRASRVIAAHLGGRIVPRPLRVEDVHAAAIEVAAARLEEDADAGPISGLRRNSLESPGKDRESP
jgi:DNA-binding response OmpR family regulator